MEAKRGDLVLHTVEHTDFILGGGVHTYSQSKLGIVTSVYRDGRVKRAAFPFSKEDINPRPYEIARSDTLHIVPQAAIDVDAAMAAYRDRAWGSDTTMIEPFSSIDDCRSFLQAYRVA